MFRKLVFVFAVVFLVASCLASCELSADDPLSQAPVSSASSSVASSVAASSYDSASSETESYSSEISIIDISDESGEESIDTSSDMSETSSEVSYPDPTFQGGDVQTPDNPDEELLPIRSITQSQTDVLELFGDIDLNDEETADAIRRIEEMIAGYDKDISFFAYSLDGSRAISYNCEQDYFSACTIKAGYMLYCCLAIEQGLASRDEVMYYQEKYYHGGSGRIKNAEYGTPYTLGELIELSLSVSDNIAYKMLFAYFGNAGYNRMVEELGVERLKLNSYSVWNYKTTARDLAIIWRELYFYFRTDTEMANLFYRSCTNTPFNYATKMLDETYSHKSGDKFAPNPVYNDAAIVWKDMPYVVATLNSSEGEDVDEEVVGTIVKLINDVIMKQNERAE